MNIFETIADEFPALRTDIVKNNPSESTHSYCRLRSRAIRMEAALLRVALLNPKAGEIGDGMLRTIASDARNALS